MNRGIPCFPSLSILDNMSRVRIRVSSKKHERRQWLDILDESSKEILLVISDNSGGGDIDYQFRETYGITQFAATSSRSSANLYIVQDYENNTLGNMNLRTYVIEITNDTDSHITIAKLDRMHSLQIKKHFFNLIVTRKHHLLLLNFSL